MSTQTTGPIYGTTKDGATIEFDASKDGHLLIEGGPGTGKTTRMRALIRSLSPAKVWVCDPLNSQFDHNRWPDAVGAVSTLEDIARIVEDVYLEMERRYRALEHGQVTAADLEPVYLVLDEPQFLTDQPAAATSEIRRQIESIARLGRSSKIHLLASTSISAPEALSQFTARVQMGRNEP